MITRVLQILWTLIISFHYQPTSYKQDTVQAFRSIFLLKPFILKSDKNLISPYIINILSRQVMRIRKVIINAMISSNAKWQDYNN